MTRSQLACFALLAAAMFQAALLAAALQNRVPQAQAEMLLPRDNIVMMTTQTSNNEECLFLLDQASGRLMVYKSDIGQRRIDLAGSQDLSQIFGPAAPGARPGGSTPSGGSRGGVR